MKRRDFLINIGLLGGWTLVGCSRPLPNLPSGSGKSGAFRYSKLVSLTPSLTETIFALGAGSRVVGVCQADDFPVCVKQLPVVSDSQVNWEKLLSLKPDCVVVDTQLSPSLSPQLDKLGLNWVGFHSQSLSGYCQTLERLSQLLEVQANGRALLEDFERVKSACLANSKKFARRPSVAIEISKEPLMFAGPGSYVEELLHLAGGRNACVAAKESYIALNLEQLLHFDPDIIILTDASKQEVLAKPGWQVLRAVQMSNIYQMEESILVRPTPRLLQGLAQLQKILVAVANPNASKAGPLE